MLGPTRNARYAFALRLGFADRANAEDSAVKVVKRCEVRVSKESRSSTRLFAAFLLD